MNGFSLNTGRQLQKKKTRQKILDSAQNLMTKGKLFSLEDVAEHSNTSRATVYRYFSNIDILCSEAGIDINTKPPEKLVQECNHKPIIEQILYIQDYYNQLAIDNEVAFRKYLSVYLKENYSKQKKLVRGARRTAALKLVLEPYKGKIGYKNYKNLIASATSLMGIEPLITTKDVCKLSNNDARKTLAWGLEMILKGSGL